jgi:hypothetical protein
MLPRIVAAFVLTLASAAAPLSAQAGLRLPGSAAENAALPLTPRVDERLFVTPGAATRVEASESARWSDTVARSRWRYPVIGAVIGLAAGIIHAQAVTSGDYVGFPVEPMYFFPPVYAAAGAVVGVMVDSADRKRRARPD